MFLKNWQVKFPLYSPDDDLSAVADPEATNADKDDDEVLNEEDSEAEETAEESDETDEKDKEGDEDKDSKEEETEEEPDDEEEEAKVRLASYSKIKKDYPDFFKKFPDVKNALFRENRYSELGTVEDFEQSQKSAEILSAIEGDMSQGNFAPFLDTIHRNDRENFEKIAIGFLPYMAEKDNATYTRIAALPIKQLLRAAARDGKGKDLESAAKWIHSYFFGNLDIDGAIPEEGMGKASQKSKREVELEERLKTIESSKSQEFVDSIDTAYVSQLEKEIRVGLDKDSRLNDYAKKNLTRDILNEIKNQLSQDKGHLAKISNLFKQARSDKYSSSSKTRIVNTALVRAKLLVPSVRTKVVSEALKSQRAQGKEKDEKSDKDNARSFQAPKSKASAPNSRNNGKDSKPKSDLDILRG